MTAAATRPQQPAATTTAAAGSDTTAAGGGETTAAGGGAAAGSLAGVCPETVVFQTDWNPEAEHGQLYNMVGDGYEVDSSTSACPARSSPAVRTPA